MSLEQQWIDFTDYKLDPASLEKILIKCSNPTAFEDLRSFPQDDIQKLIEKNILIHIGNNNYQFYLAEAHKLFNKYKRLMMELYPILNLRKNIRLLKLAWKEFSNLMYSMANNYADHAPLNEEEIINLEFCISNILSIICKIRDGLKGSIILTDNDKITSNLIEKYSKYQAAYNNLLTNTIDKPIIRGFNDFLRNRLLHGGSMLFTKAHIKIPLDKIKVLILSIALCDYGLLESSNQIEKSNNVKKNLYLYYFDINVYFMKQLVNKNITWEQLDNETQESLKNEIKIRLNVNSVDDSTITDRFKELLENKDSVLFHYNTLKKKQVPGLGQFSVNISELLKNIYDEYLNLYSTLYGWLKLDNKDSIDSILSIRQSLINSNTPGLIINDILDFELPHTNSN